ncbi:N-acetylmannosamine kinase [Clostridium botulinum C str. Eklund]|nr:N-acetylmannosamine kinase [Clostridium botulinum C str. Eklund]NEZ48151.1 ROK family protein [Clostridium botulinum]
MNYLGIDIGGTRIKYGVADDKGEINEIYYSDTQAYKGAEQLIITIKKIINEILQNNFIKGIGISTAGQVDSHTGEIIFATETIPGWTGVKLKDIIQNTFNIPCCVDNDVNCACLGEMWKGNMGEHKNVIFLTLGTGIGGAIIIDKKLYSGSNFIAGEIGHINLYKDGERCTCGANGCFERYASTAALIKRAKHRLNLDENFDLSGEDIFSKAKDGEEIYISIIDEWSYDIALGLKSIIYMFNPSLVIIGGGVSAQGDYLIGFIKRHLNSITMPSFLKHLQIKTAKYGDSAGILGAVYRLRINSVINSINL